VLSYGAGFEALGLIIGVGAGLSLIQLIFSVWAMTANWVDAQERALRSAIRNRELARSFERISSELLNDPVGPRREYDRLVGRDDSQQDNDYALGFTKAETRAAHRAGLRQHRAMCSACEKIPTDMTADDCGVCGDFVWKRTRGFVDRRRTHPNRAIPAGP
jgi:mobilome CxxCx(11)CxxC protein